MDTLERYRKIIVDVLTRISEWKISNGEVVNEAVFDRDHDRYLILTTGWESKTKRIHHCLVHLEIVNGKVWVQRDNTEYGVTCELEKAGIPKSEIVLGFHPLSVRPHTGYAVA